MNTIIRNWHPGSFKEAEQKVIAKYGKTWDEMFLLKYTIGDASETLP